MADGVEGGLPATLLASEHPQPRTPESLRCVVVALLVPSHLVVDGGQCSDSVVVVVEYIAKLPQSAASVPGDSCCCTPPHSPSGDALFHCCGENQTWTFRTPQGFDALGASYAEVVQVQGIQGHLHSAFARETALG